MEATSAARPEGTAGERIGSDTDPTQPPLRAERSLGRAGSRGLRRRESDGVEWCGAEFQAERERFPVHERVPA